MHCSSDKRKTTYFGSSTDKFLGRFYENKHLIYCWNFSAELGENLTLLHLYTRPSSQPLSWLIQLCRAASLWVATPQVKKPPEERGVENKSPCHFHSLVISSGSVGPTEAKGAPGDRRNGEGAAWKADPSGAVPARHTQPGHHFQSARRGRSGPKGRGWLCRCPEGEQLKRTRKWDHRIAN